MREGLGQERNGKGRQPAVAQTLMKWPKEAAKLGVLDTGKLGW